MKRPTMKDTKDVIMAYAKGLEAELTASKEGKFDPAEVKETERKKDVTVKASKIINRGIVNEEIMAEYNALEEKISDMKAELEVLAGIEVNVNTLAALIEANNIEIEEAQIAKDEIVAEKKAELAELQVQIDSLEATRSASEKEYTDNLKKTRTREEADYKYTTGIAHRDAEDKWTTDLNSRKKALADQEASVADREIRCKEIEQENAELKSDAAYVEARIAEITKSAKEDAEKKMSTVLAIKEAAMKKEVTVDLQLVNQKLTAVESALIKSEDKVAELEIKLAKAYQDMNTLASTTVQASRPVYMERETTNNK